MFEVIDGGKKDNKENTTERYFPNEAIFQIFKNEKYNGLIPYFSIPVVKDNRFTIDETIDILSKRFGCGPIPEPIPYTESKDDMILDLYMNACVTKELDENRDLLVMFAILNPDDNWTIADYIRNIINACIDDEDDDSGKVIITRNIHDHEGNPLSVRRKRSDIYNINFSMSETVYPYNVDSIHDSIMKQIDEDIRKHIPQDATEVEVRLSFCYATDVWAPTPKK